MGATFPHRARTPSQPSPQVVGTATADLGTYVIETVPRQGALWTAGARAEIGKSVANS
jgi:hypothetical protein